MTFTYTGDLTDDTQWVRFETGDTTSDQAFLTDEVIDSLIAREGTVQKAVIKCFQYIITQLSKPDFKADWLSVTNGEARKGYEKMLSDKRREYGLNPVSASVVYTYRSDSDMEDPN